MLIFLDVSNVFHVSIGVVYTIWHILDSISIEEYVRHLKKSKCNWVKMTIFIHFLSLGTRTKIYWSFGHWRIPILNQSSRTKNILNPFFYSPFPFTPLVLWSFSPSPDIFPSSNLILFIYSISLSSFLPPLP